ncbi:hypothetical protein NDU88_008506, partial [Pleurodeles waltl]
KRIKNRYIEVALFVLLDTTIQKVSMVFTDYKKCFPKMKGVVLWRRLKGNLKKGRSGMKAVLGAWAQCLPRS